MKKLVSFAAAGTLAVFGALAQSKAESPEAVYKRACASCHGADMSGATTMGKAMKLRDLRSPEVQKMTDARLFDAIARGKGKMPAYGAKLGDENVHALVKYIRAQAKK